MTGVLVAIEGPKAVGKTMLVSQLRARSEQTRDWVFTKEPTKAFDLENERRHTGIALAEMIAKDRARHVAEVIAPALRRGQVVVTDRYVLSSFVFHCSDGVSTDAVTGLNARFPRPGILLLLQCSAHTLSNRRVQRGQPTRLLSKVSPEDDLLGYLTYASRCRPTCGEIILGYHETPADSQAIAERLITEVNTKRFSRV